MKEPIIPEGFAPDNLMMIHPDCSKCKMSMGLEELKRKYNEALAREKKAEMFFDDPAVPMEKKERWLPEFHGIVRELSGMMMEFRLTSGREMSEMEALEGFEIE